MSAVGTREAQLNEDSWDPDEASGEFEVEKVLDARYIARTRASHWIEGYKIKWKGYGAPEWIPRGVLTVADFCASLMGVSTLESVSRKCSLGASSRAWKSGNPLE
ncbi:hypothetical protein L914_20262 [Phytophthora nicotianae]|uniref:Chromo domain-containing protein n=2 Tax=Phytophthora nicotianae TaxID=4792 RepID=V9EF26_PHYNI|nr:hypothetical protein F443_16356 [Phytophthora nicotianae P1569]ETM32314.1 hypothetical protein L914_20262 [Phytophthora nicotianae]